MHILIYPSNQDNYKFMYISFVNYKFVFTKSSTNCNHRSFDYIIIPKILRQSLLASSLQNGNKILSTSLRLLNYPQNTTAKCPSFKISKRIIKLSTSLRLMHYPQNTTAKCPSFKVIKLNKFNKLNLNPVPNMGCNRAVAQWLAYVQALA